MYLVVLNSACSGTKMGLNVDEYGVFVWLLLGLVQIERARCGIELCSFMILCWLFC